MNLRKINLFLNSKESIFFLLINFIVFKALYPALFLCLGNSHLQMGQFLHIGLNRLCHNYPFYCNFTVKEVVFFSKWKFQSNSNALVNISSFPISKGSGPWSTKQNPCWWIRSGMGLQPLTITLVSHVILTVVNIGCLLCAWRMGVVLYGLSHLIFTAALWGVGIIFFVSQLRESKRHVVHLRKATSLVHGGARILTQAASN